MSFNIWFLVVQLIVVALVPTFFLAYNTHREPVVIEQPRVVEQPFASVQFETEQKKTLEPGSEFNVKACKVLDGYRFEMYLESNKWIIAHLAQATNDEAAPVVTDLLNKTTHPMPMVKLVRQVGEYWIVEFYLTVDGKQSNLVDVLREKGLIL